MRARTVRWLVVVAAALGAATAAPGGRTQTFLQTSEDDFAEGEAEGVVYTSLGTLRLGRAVESLLEETEGVEYVADLAEGPDGAVYVVTGGGGRVYRLRGEKVEPYVTLEDAYLFSCAVGDDGTLYVGSGGLEGRVFRVTAGDGGEPKVEVFYEDAETRYVWDLVCLADGSLAAATGDQGKLMRIGPDGKAEVLIDAEADHVLCLAAAGEALYAGTDGEALVYRWAGGEAFVLYDAGEAEVTDLAVDGEGNVYAAVSSGVGGRSGGAQPGRPVTPEPSAPADRDGEDEAFDLQGRSGEASGEADADAGPEAVEEDEGLEVVGVEPEPGDEDKMESAAAMSVSLKQAVSAARAAARAAREAAGKGGGAGVYCISPEGIVTPIFSARDEMVLALAVDGESLLVGSGRDAHVYELDLADGDGDARLAGLDPSQVMALLVTGAGRVVVGTAGPGRLYALSRGYAGEGTYTSRVFDAGGSARWGALDWRGSVPEGTEIRLSSRSGNVGDPEKGFWSAWSKETSRSATDVASPAARFVQFRVTMRTRRDDATPVLEQFEAAYLRANEPPAVLSVTEKAAKDNAARAEAIERMRQAAQGAKGAGNGPPAATPQPAGPQPVRVLVWEAEDPNGDTLRYDLYFHPQGSESWVLLASDLDQPTYRWDTSTVADGWYEIEVVAGDWADNPAETALEGSRISEPMLVDNTAPVVGRVGVWPAGEGMVELRFRAADETSRLTRAAYTVDSAEKWEVVVPTDGLFDREAEDFAFRVEGLEPGSHWVAVRVSDEAGNTGRAAVTVRVEE